MPLRVGAQIVHTPTANPTASARLMARMTGLPGNPVDPHMPHTQRSTRYSMGCRAHACCFPQSVRSILKWQTHCRR